MEREAPQLTADTLSGDIRDWLLTWIRSMQKPFQQLPEGQQRDVIEAAEASARELIGGVISVVSGRGFERAFVKLGQFTVKDGIEAKLVTSRVERNLLNFNNFAGRQAVLIFADPQEFDGQRGPATVFKVQRDIEEVIAEAKAAEATKPVATLDEEGVVIAVDATAGAAGAAKEIKGDLRHPVTGKTLGTVASDPLQDDHRLAPGETVDPETGEIVTEDWSQLQASDTRTVAPAVVVEELPELPKTLDRRTKKVRNPAKPGTIDANDPGEPETVTVDDTKPASKPSMKDPFDGEPNE